MTSVHNVGLTQLGPRPMGYDTAGAFPGHHDFNSNVNPAVTPVVESQLKAALESIGAPVVIAPQAASQIPHSLGTVQETFSQAPTKRVAEFIVMTSVLSRSFPHFQLLKPRQAVEDEIAGFSVGTVRFGTQLPSELPEGVSARTISHTYETTLFRHDRYGQATRHSRDFLNTAKGAALLGKYIMALSSNSTTLAQICVTSALLRCKDKYREERRVNFVGGSHVGDPYSSKILDPVGSLHRADDMIYQLINFARSAMKRQGGSQPTHMLCTGTVFPLLAYGNKKETEFYRRGPTAPQILVEGGEYFRDTTIHGVQIIEEPSYDFMRHGDEGRNGTNLLKRTLEVGRHYIMTRANMVHKDVKHSVKLTSDLAYLNMDEGKGAVMKQCYLDLLDACSCFDAATGELAPRYSKNVESGGEALIKEARKMGYVPPSFEQGGRVDPFIAWQPGQNPKVVQFLGEQDIYYVSKDDQRLVVDRAVAKLTERLDHSEISAIRNVIKLANDWHSPIDHIGYTERFGYAVWGANKMAGNGTFTNNTKLPFAVSNGNEFFLGVEPRVEGIVCDNVSSPGVLAMLRPNNTGPTPCPDHELDDDFNAKMEFYEGGNSQGVVNFDKPDAAVGQETKSLIKVFSKIRHLIPNLTTASNLSMLMTKRSGNTIKGAKTLKPVTDVISLTKRFGVRVIPDFLPGFSRFDNMAYLANISETQLLSHGVHGSIKKGVEAMIKMMGFLSKSFSVANAPNYFFDKNMISFDQRLPRGSGNAHHIYAGANNILFGRKPESVFQFPATGFFSGAGVAEREFIDPEYSSLHEDCDGYNASMEYLAATRQMKMLPDADPEASRLREVFGKILGHLGLEKGELLANPTKGAAGKPIFRLLVDDYWGKNAEVASLGGRRTRGLNFAVEELGGAVAGRRTLHGSKKQYLYATELFGLDLPALSDIQTFIVGNVDNIVGDVLFHTLQNPGFALEYDGATKGKAVMKIFDYIASKKGVSTDIGKIATMFELSVNMATNYETLTDDNIDSTLASIDQTKWDGYVAYWNRTLGSSGGIYASLAPPVPAPTPYAKANQTLTLGKAQLAANSSDFATPDSVTGVTLGVPQLDAVSIKFGLSLGKTYWEHVSNTINDIIDRSSLDLKTVDPALGTIHEIELDPRDLPAVNLFFKSIVDSWRRSPESLSHMRPTDFQGRTIGVTPKRFYQSNLRFIPYINGKVLNTEVVESWLASVEESANIEGFYNGAQQLRAQMGLTSSIGNKMANTYHRAPALRGPLYIPMSDASFSQTAVDYGKQNPGGVDVSDYFKPYGNAQQNIEPDFTNPWWSERMLASGGDVDDPVWKSANSAYCGTRVHRDSFAGMYNEDVPPPLGFLVVDLFIRIGTSALVFVAAGEDTGWLSWALPMFAHSFDADHGMDSYTFTWMMGSSVFRAENVCIIPDAVFEGYYGGGGCSLIKTGLGDRSAQNMLFDTYLDVRDAGVDYNPASRARRGDRFVFPIGWSRKDSDFPDFICYGGSAFDPGVGLLHWIPKDVLDAGTRVSSFPFDSALLTADKFQFRTKITGLPLDPASNYVSETADAGNLMSAKGDRWGYSPGSGDYTIKTTEGRGPIGSLNPGCVEAIRGGPVVMERINTMNSGIIKMAS